MDDLLSDFVAETRELLEALGGEIVAWEANPAARERLDAIFRFVHTVKGNCGFFDFPRLQALSHAAEDALADVRAGRRRADATLVTAVLAIIDRISDMIEAIAAGAELPPGGDEALMAALASGGDAPDIVPGAGASGEAGGPRVLQRSVRLPVELLDRVMSGVSDIVLARNEMARCLRDLSAGHAVESAFDRMSALVTELRDAMTRTRMQPIDGLLASLPRLVRDLAAQMGKQVMIDLDGGDVELDREMIELIRDPVVHIVRNAIDHGIELPAARLAAGKREIGMLVISARQAGNQILIDMIDDGRGIDDSRLVETALAAGIVTEAEAASMSHRDKLMLVCEPGLSTAQTVTAISGRGVGMDVVRANVERIGGSIDIESAIGQGTRIALRVPLTLTITPALTVAAGGQVFAVPRSFVEEVISPEAEDTRFSQLGDGLVAVVRDRALPALDLGALLLDRPVDPSARRGNLVVVHLAGGIRYLLAVDAILDHEDLVVKPVAPSVMATGLYVGATLSDSGRPTLLIDVNGLARLGGIALDVHAPQAPAREAAEAQEHGEPALVFTAWNGMRRALPLALAERVEEVPGTALRLHGPRPTVLVGDEVLPLAGTEGLDQQVGSLRVVVVSEAGLRLAYAVQGATGIAGFDGSLVTQATGGEIAGVALIGGEQVELIDPAWLFAHAAAPTARPDAPACWLPLDDGWTRDFLRPFVESAGYRIVADPDEAQVVISMGDTAPGGEARHLRLRETALAGPGDGGSVYRFDLAGIGAALRDAGEEKAA